VTDREIDEDGVGHKVSGPGTQGGATFGEFEVWAVIDGEDRFVTVARTEAEALDAAREVSWRALGKLQHIYIVRVVR